MVSFFGKLSRRAHTRLRDIARTCRPQLEALEERSLMSASPVAPAPSPPNTAGSPLAGVVELKVTYPDNQTAVGTGALIDGSHVLTAAHLLYSAKDGGYATSVEAIPAANYFNDPVGVAFGTNERVDPSWLTFNPSHPGATSPAVADVGLVTLDRPIGNSTGWFTLGTKGNTDAFTGATFDTAGFPGGPVNAPPLLFAGAGKAVGAVSKDGIEFTQSSLPALPGQSGSPIYQVSDKGVPVIYGVLTGADGFSPSSDVYASRITHAVYAEIQSWEKADQTLQTNPDAPTVLQHPAVTSPPSDAGTASTQPAIRALDDYYYDPNYDYAGDFNYNAYDNFGYDGSGFTIPPSPLQYGGVGDGLNLLGTMYGGAAVAGAGMAASPYLYGAAEPWLYGLGYNAYQAYQSDAGQLLSGYYGPTTGPSGYFYQDLGAGWSLYNQ